MASIMPNGARYAVATQLSAAAAITAITNAAPPVASAVAPPAEGAILLMISNWPEINGVAVRTGDVTANSFELEGYDSLDTVRYPVGEGAGAFQVASAFVSLSKVRTVEMSGGEQNFYTYQYVEDASGRQQQAPTFKSAQSMALAVDYDPALPHFNALVEMDRKREVAILRETLVNGDVLYYSGWLSFNKVPSKVLNEFMANQLTFSLTGDPIRYRPVTP